MTADEFSMLGEELESLETRVKKLRPKNPIEERTKLALVLPFFKSLGYDLTDPCVCEPEYRAGWATDDKDKVDYALFDGNGNPMILVECKRLSEKLDIKAASQLAKYFANTDARIGILTNGANYEIYLDTVKENVMDEEPFFKFDLTDSDDVDRRVIALLSRKSDGSVNLEGFTGEVREWEAEKKYKPQAMDVFKAWLIRPDEEFVRLIEKRLKAPEGSLDELTQEWFAEFVYGKSLPPTNGDGDTTPSGNCGGGEGLVSLPDWPISDASDLPDEIIFPDGKRAQINDGYDVAVKTVGWLLNKGHLKRDSLPILTGKKQRGTQHLVSDTPSHPNGSRMRSPQEISGVFVDGSFSASSQVENAQRIIQYAHQDPSEFKGEFPAEHIKTNSTMGT